MCVNFNELLGGLLEEDRQSIVTEALLSNQIAINNLWSCKPLPRADSSQLISAVENVPEHKPTFTSSYQPSPPPNYLTVIGFKYCVACQCFAPCSFGNENSLYLTYHRFTFMHMLNYWSWVMVRVKTAHPWFVHAPFNICSKSRESLALPSYRLQRESNKRWCNVNVNQSFVLLETSFKMLLRMAISSSRRKFSYSL